MEHGLFRQNQVAIAELGRNVDLQAIFFRQRERRPLAVLRRIRIVVHYHEIKFTDQATHQFGGFGVTVDPSQNMAGDTLIEGVLDRVRACV